MKKLLVKIFTAILMAMISWSPMAKEPSNVKMKSKNCHIMITSQLNTGESRAATRRFHYKTKDKCEKMNRILSDNMNPSEIVSVKTKMQWGGK